MQNIWKEKLLLIRLLNKDNSMDIVWNGQERLRISMPSMSRSMVQDIVPIEKMKLAAGGAVNAI